MCTDSFGFLLNLYKVHGVGKHWPSMKTQCFHPQFQGIHSQLGAEGCPCKQVQACTPVLYAAGVCKEEWKKRDELLNTLKHEVTGDTKLTGQTGHPYRKETVFLELSLSSPSSMQNLFHSYQDF